VLTVLTVLDSLDGVPLDGGPPAANLADLERQAGAPARPAG
jgi:hypothetical protein